MRFKLVSIVATTFALLISTKAFAEAGPAIELLKQAEAASMMLSSISYEASAYGEGDLSKIIPAVSGKVVAQRGPSDPEHRMAIHGNITTVGAPPVRFSFVSDGNQAIRIDHGQKSCLNGASREARVIETAAIVPSQYLNEHPYAMELAAVAAQIEPSQSVDGVACDVVKVQYDRVGQREARFYLGKKDHLLRRLDRMITGEINGVNAKQTVVYSCKGLQAGIKIDAKTFTLDCPVGYTKKTFAEAMRPPGPPPAQQSPQGSLGGDSPDWTLKNSEGKEVSLKSLRGRVVMLDFWATWCGPCKMAMPGVQKIYEHFKGKPVDVFGANCWERSGPEGAIKYVKDKGYTYPQLLGADKLATQFGVRGIPTFVIIGPDGKVLHMRSGYDASGEEQIISIIENAMKK
jgi:thiol-disulfide isomerase/thioredoxin